MHLASVQDFSVCKSQIFLEQLLCLQVLEDEAALPEAPEHRDPDVHSGLVPVRADSPVRLLAFRLGPQHRQGAALPLLRQERHQVHHQVAGVAPAAHRVQASIQDAHGGRPQTESLALRIEIKEVGRSQVAEVRAVGLFLRHISNFKYLEMLASMTLSANQQHSAQF